MWWLWGEDASLLFRRHWDGSWLLLKFVLPHWIPTPRNMKSEKSFGAFHSDGYLSITACCSQNSSYCCLLKMGLSSKSCLRSIRSASRRQDRWTSSFEISKRSRIQVRISKLSKSVPFFYVCCNIRDVVKKYQQCLVINIGVHFIQPWKFLKSLRPSTARNSGSFAIKLETTHFNFTRFFSLPCSCRLRSLNF